jgi:hypothetical protein
MVLSIASSKNFSGEKAHKLYITLECMLGFDKVAERGIEKTIQEKHKLNARYVKDAVLLKERIKRLMGYLSLLLSYTRDGGKSGPAAQQAVNRERKPMKGRAKLLITPCLEWCRDHSPLKRVLISGDWVSKVLKEFLETRMKGCDTE